MPIGNFGPISDKAYLGYLPSYLKIAAELGPHAKVCEIGVFHGESLEWWKSVFPYGEITGVDSNPASTWPTGTHPVVIDAADPALPGMLDGPFGLIVDDGSHMGKITEATFTNLWPLVAPGGYYAVEDWYVGLSESEIGKGVYPAYDGNSMLTAMQSLLPLLSSRDAEVDEIVYRYGLAIVHKRRGR